MIKYIKLLYLSMKARYVCSNEIKMIYEILCKDKDVNSNEYSEYIANVILYRTVEYMIENDKRLTEDLALYELSKNAKLSCKKFEHILKLC